MPPFEIIYLPTEVDPVKAILSTPRCLTRASPALSPNPGTTLTTPSGTPASIRISASSKAVKGVYSAGFKTTVFPQAKAGAILKVAIKSGKFHGTICPQTPTGSSLV
jgi:hypothetical protein